MSPSLLRPTGTRQPTQSSNLMGRCEEGGVVGEESGKPLGFDDSQGPIHGWRMGRGERKGQAYCRQTS